MTVVSLANKSTAASGTAAPRRGDAEFMSDIRAAALEDKGPLAGLSVWLLVLVVVVFFWWASEATLDEVTRGSGTVIPSSREQVIQSLEGGILAELYVDEGDDVAAGEALLRIDDTQSGASLREGQAKQQALKAAIIRYRAEAEGTAPVFPDDLPAATVAREQQLYDSRLRALQQSLSARQRSLTLADKELRLTEPLVKDGVVSEVEVLRLRREVNELRADIADIRNNFRAAARSELAEKQAELDGITEINTARADQVRRAVVRAPMHGTVKNIRFNTVGGVISPGQRIMEIVPLEDRLLVEARIPPQDVAFLRPGLAATVKITAYDYSIYGGLKGKVEHISADTFSDERDPDNSYYKVRVRTDTSHLDGRDGPLPIIPGMTATVEVLTGEKTVLDYLLKPLLKARQNAMHER